ncbi:MAG: sensor domain-containing diguanylate cyclase [Myxococcaceae bacterium]|nr:sensor domain-containing diguanylate cyclase [Myxococcaceae bacterium]
MNPADLLGALQRNLKQLAAFNDIAKALTSTLELKEVLKVIGATGSQMLGAERWSLLLADEGGMLNFEIAVGPGAERLKALAVVAGEGIAGTVYATGKARLVADVKNDPDFAPRFDQVTALATKSIVAVPLAVRGRTLGVLELVNGPGSPDFTQDDLHAATAIADFAAIAIDNAQNFQRVQELTLIDEHTGLGNVRALKLQLEREVARCRRFARPLSVCFIDLDKFKQVNDTHGHLAGSNILRQVGGLLRETARAVDPAFRYGGDEFALLLLETNMEGAQRAGLRVLDELSRRAFEISPGVTVSLSASIGCASFPEHGQTAEGLIEAADRAMYRVKRSGRNGVAVA